MNDEPLRPDFRASLPRSVDGPGPAKPSLLGTSHQRQADTKHFAVSAEPNLEAQRYVNKTLGLEGLRRF